MSLATLANLVCSATAKAVVILQALKLARSKTACTVKLNWQQMLLEHLMQQFTRKTFVGQGFLLPSFAVHRPLSHTSCAEYTTRAKLSDLHGAMNDALCWPAVECSAVYFSANADIEMHYMNERTPCLEHNPLPKLHDHCEQTVKWGIAADIGSSAGQRHTCRMLCFCCSSCCRNWAAQVVQAACMCKRLATGFTCSVSCCMACLC